MADNTKEDLGAEPIEYLFKVLVVGDIGTGKTSIIKRYVHNFFSPAYKSTIGVDFALKVINWDQHTVVRLQLWDIAGQERFGNMTRVYYKEAVAAMVVYDITRPATFEAITKWKNDIDHKVILPDGRPIPCVLLANKCDLPSSVTKSQEEMNAFCSEMGFVGWLQTSAKDNKNINEAARFLVEKILENHIQIPAETNPDVIDVSAPQKGKTSTGSDKSAQEGKGCC